MKYLSLFSGIEAATVAWHPLGWTPVAFSEIDKTASKFLAETYPYVPNLGDVTKITEEMVKSLGKIDVIIGGSPCQDLSIAGKQRGLDGERSGLFRDAIRIIQWARKHCGLRFALWENVPGAYSSNAGRDFTEVVASLAGLEDLDTPANGWGKEGAAVGDNGLLEWACLDAQWFGLAARRKRVFALLDFGDWESRPPILLEPESLRGDYKPSRKARETITSETGIPLETFSHQGFGGYALDNLASTLSARDHRSCTDLVEHHTHSSSFYSNVGLRRLTPLEHERLQGFPEIERRIQICIDKQKSHVNAENQNLKSQNAVLNAEKTESKETVSSVQKNLNAKSQLNNPHVALSALINLEQSTLQIHSQEKLALSANLAGEKSSSLHLTHLGDIARLLVQQMKGLGLKAINGKEGSQQSIKNSLAQENGSLRVNLSGQEIEELVSDVGLFTVKVSDYMKSTTKEVGLNSKNCEQNLRTLCCFVLVAINLFIREKIPNKSLYELNLSITHGYTASMINLHRYRTLGNSMAVPVIRYIGEKIMEAIRYNIVKRKRPIYTPTLPIHSVDK